MLLAIGSASAAETAAKAPADMTATELATAAREAYAKEDYAAASDRLEQLSKDYGANAEVAPLIVELRPVMAMCQIRADKFAEALETIELCLKEKSLPAPARDELSFWKGVALLKTDKPDKSQEALGEYFADEKHDRRQRYEAFLLFGAGYLQQDDAVGAVEFFGSQIPKIPVEMRDVAGRAAVLYLHALTEAKQYKSAVQVVRDSYPKLADMPQVISFQTLTLALGAKLLEDEKFQDAIICFQRVWSKERLIKHQRARLDQYVIRKEELKKEGNRQSAILQLSGMMTSIQRELENFEKVESFDAASRLRLAQCYLGLGRPLEGALILEQMVGIMKPDAVVREGALTLLRCWLQLERWEKALAAAALFEEKFAEDSDAKEGMIEALFSRGEAKRGLSKLAEAEDLFQQVGEKFPKSELAPRALFLTGICQLSRDDNQRAMATFQDVRKLYPKNELAEDTEYWEGMALAFEGDHEAARKQLSEYLKRFPDGRYQADAAFSKAHEAYNMADHATASKELAAFIKDHGDTQHGNEARLLLGESLMAQAEVEEGIKMLKSMDPAEAKFYEEGQFKIGEALKKLGKPAEIVEHFAKFAKEHPESPRLAESVLMAGKGWQLQGHPEKAVEMYWEAIAASIDKPEIAGVEDLLAALPRLSPGPDKKRDLLFKLQQLAEAALEKKQMTAATRYRWAMGHAHRDTSPELAKAAFLDAGLHAKVETTAPRILADAADAQRQSGHPLVARELYFAIRKWNPRCLEKERASLGIALLAMEEGKTAEAMDWLDRCLKESLTGGVEGTALLAKAKLLRSKGDFVAASESATKVLENKLMTTRQKSEALMEIGLSQEAAGVLEKAASAYKRMYLSFGREKDLAAAAYLAHGMVLEKMKDQVRARAVYEEMLAKKDMLILGPAIEAKQRLERLAP